MSILFTVFNQAR